MPRPHIYVYISREGSLILESLILILDEVAEWIWCTSCVLLTTGTDATVSSIFSLIPSLSHFFPLAGSWNIVPREGKREGEIKKRLPDGKQGCVSRVIPAAILGNIYFCCAYFCFILILIFLPLLIYSHSSRSGNDCALKSNSSSGWPRQTRDRNPFDSWQRTFLASEQFPSTDTPWFWIYPQACTSFPLSLPADAFVSWDHHASRL